jgi:hypothetical protein
MSSLSPRSSLTHPNPKVACSIQSFTLRFIVPFGFERKGSRIQGVGNCECALLDIFGSLWSVGYL